MARTRVYQPKRSKLFTAQLLTLLTRARLSREEREAAYIRARERIFGKDVEKTGEETPGLLFS